MGLVRLKGRVDANGRLTVVVPWPTSEGEIEVFVRRTWKPNSSRAEFMERLRDTFGIDPDFERPAQGELPPPASW